MRIILNGFEETIPEGLTLLGLINHTQEGDLHLIVELNGRFIPEKDWDHHLLNENDRVEFINPCFGG